MRWICSIWLLVLLVASGEAFAFVLPTRLALSSAITFAYDGHNQSKPAYDGRLESTIGYDAVLEHITEETRNETTENRVLFAKFAELVAAKTAPRVVNAQTIQTALEGSTMQTTQNAISIPAVERYVRMLEAGSPAPPIKVAEGVIVDGNHTYTAGRVFGVEPPQVPGTLSPSQASQVKPIQTIKLDPTDWGNL